ncbi:hypothetical protein [Longitalea luteola]|uniref:hypothetical protein n=1 Tax=Longitalea luteola TaxID=2812563 RepID=UPI001A96AB3B|nr:hypothetical protein [Longitalea luteola]
MIRVYVLCLWLLAAETGSAQRIKYQGLKADTGTVYLRHNPLGWMDFLDGNVTVGGEYRFNRTWSATLDAGAIWYSTYLPKTRQATGLLLRPGARLYPGKYKDYFIDLQLHYKQVMYHVKDWIERDVVQDVASYEELARFRFKKRVMGVHIMGGLKQYFTNNRRFFMEIYLGLGVHFKKEGLYNEPPDSRFEHGFRMLAQNDRVSENNTTNVPGKRVLPAVPGGLRIIYRLR